MSPARKNDTPATPEYLDGFEAEGWRPEAGDQITGTLASLNAGFSDYTQASYPILTLDVSEERNLVTGEAETHDPPKQIAVHAFQAVLRNELLNQRPEVGERITLACGGKRAHKTAKAQTVTVYKVTVHREGVSGAGWDDLFGPRGGAPTPPANVPAGVDAATGEVDPRAEFGF